MLATAMELEPSAGARITTVNTTDSITVTFAAADGPGRIDRLFLCGQFTKRVFNTLEFTATNIKAHGLAEDYQLFSASTNIPNHFALAIIQEIGMIGNVFRIPDGGFLKKLHVVCFID